MANTYTCSVCGNLYNKGWSDEEAAVEYEKNFGVPLGTEETNIVCDYCYRKFMSWADGLELDLTSRDEVELHDKIAEKPEVHNALKRRLS